MIVVHELAHLKEKEHNKAFYQLCCHMEPQYHQLEFDTRLWLTQLSLGQDKNLKMMSGVIFSSFSA
ncbi:metal dependent hydrolase [Escherichia coli]|uniref:Metal dependent hydrolase n=1 Tax=Escherichia coli TaxID=562 RepID=A0A376LC57_ECOLX|nr:metal dependent hydrolase [Escherichia coli]